MGHCVRLLAGVVLLGLAGPAVAADLPEPGYWPEPRRAPGPPPAPRYFPRGDSDASPARGQPPCQDFVPTNSFSDPTYVGSPFGLGKPSYYGFPPPRGVDDPYGRRLARGCF